MLTSKHKDGERELKAMRRRSEDLSANLKSTVEASRAHQRELEGSSQQLREELLALRSQHRDTEARLHEASRELRRIKGGTSAEWLVRTRCLEAEVLGLEQETEARVAAAAELRKARRDAAAAGEAAEAADARSEAAEARAEAAEADAADARARRVGADPALRAENESLRQQVTALQQERAELQAELQRAVQRAELGEAGAGQVARVATDAAVLVGGMHELERELTLLLEQGGLYM